MELILIVIAVVALWGIYALWKYQHLKSLARQYAQSAQQFHKKLKELTAPDHFFTDEELQALKSEYNPLVYKINSLYKTSLVSNDFLDDLHLFEFIEERRVLNHTQYTHNQSLKDKK